MRRLRINSAQLLQSFFSLIPAEKDRLSCPTFWTLVHLHPRFLADRFYANNFHHFKIAAPALRGTLYGHVMAPLYPGTSLAEI
jgi:hypothetical protein